MRGPPIAALSFAVAIFGATLCDALRATSVRTSRPSRSGSASMGIFDSLKKAFDDVERCFVHVDYDFRDVDEHDPASWSPKINADRKVPLV